MGLQINFRGGVSGFAVERVDGVNRAQPGMFGAAPTGLRRERGGEGYPALTRWAHI